MKKYTFKHTTGDRIPIDDAMIELRNRMLPAFGYVIRDVCSLRLANPNAKHATFRCVEKEALDTTWSDNGALCSSFHAVYVDTKSGDGECYQWPDEVMKAAHAIDKSKPAKAKK